MRLCTVEGCELRYRSNGYCKKHFALYYRYGRPEPLPPKPIKQRLLEKIVIDENGCWIWRGCIASKGYASIIVDGKSRLAHRLSYEAFIGPLGTLLACHKCDVRRCINPDHLFAGTHFDNVADMWAKGRGAKDSFANCPEKRARGERHGRATVDWVFVNGVRALYATESFTHRGIADLLSVPFGTVSHILSYRTWKEP